MNKSQVVAYLTLLITMSIMLISTFLVLLVPVCLYLRASCRSKNPAVLPTDWPILHMFPSFMANLHNLYDYFTLVLARSGHNFRAHGPPGTGMRLFITCDPANADTSSRQTMPTSPRARNSPISSTSWVAASSPSTVSRAADNVRKPRACSAARGSLPVWQPTSVARWRTTSSHCSLGWRSLTLHSTCMN